MDYGEKVLGLEVEVSEWDVVSQVQETRECHLKVRDVKWDKNE